jgi:hypothetical protein
MASGFVWFVGTFTSQDDAQVAIDNFKMGSVAGYILKSFIVPAN